MKHGKGQLMHACGALCFSKVITFSYKLEPYLLTTGLCTHLLLKLPEKIWGKNVSWKLPALPTNLVMTFPNVVISLEVAESLPARENRNKNKGERNIQAESLSHSVSNLEQNVDTTWLKVILRYFTFRDKFCCLEASYVGTPIRVVQASLLQAYAHFLHCCVGNKLCRFAPSFQQATRSNGCRTALEAALNCLKFCFKLP